jgi:hypothetical protein
MIPGVFWMIICLICQSSVFSFESYLYRLPNKTSLEVYILVNIIAKKIAKRKWNFYNVQDKIGYERIFMTTAYINSPIRTNYMTATYLSDHTCVEKLYVFNWQVDHNAERISSPNRYSSLHSTANYAEFPTTSR